MARLRRSVVVGARVPAELMDKGHAVWRDAGLFGAWCRREGVLGGPVAGTWAERFGWAVLAWAVANGYGDEAERGDLDWRRFRLLGIPRCGGRDRLLARAEAEGAA